MDKNKRHMRLEFVETEESPLDEEVVD